MRSNKKIRKKLEKQYGKGDMFKKAHIEEKIEEKKTIKTYKQFKEEKHFTGKMIYIYENQMNLHHLIHRAEGGKTTVENGAVINSLAHMYMHSLPREDEEFINEELRQYKQDIDECRVVLVDEIETPYKICPLEVYIKGYDRNKRKQEDKELIKEWEDEK